MMHWMKPWFDTYHQFAAVREPRSHGEVLHVFGDVDHSSALQLETEIETALEASETLVVNFSECRYLDTHGLALLVRTGKRFGSRVAVLVRPNTIVARVLQITEFDRALAVITELSPRDVRTSASAPNGLDAA